MAETMNQRLPNIVLSDRSRASGYIAARDYKGTPDHTGFLERIPVALPEYSRGCGYYQTTFKPEILIGNALEPRVFTTLSDSPHGGLFMVLELTDGQYLALLPISGPLNNSWLTSAGDSLVLELATMGTEAVEGDVPLLAWAFSSSPYRASRQAWEAALAAPELGREATRLRQKKVYPDYFRYLGWCTWEEYKTQISSDIVKGAVHHIEASDIPIRWMLIDDGHHDVKDSQLVSFEPDKEKFPEGFAPLLACRKEDKVKWFGIWLHTTGYMEKIHPDNQLGETNEHLRQVVLENGKVALIPKGDPASAKAYYQDMIGRRARDGFDFLKIDFQSQLYISYFGNENASASAWNNYRAMEHTMDEAGLGLMNCICMNHSRIFSMHSSPTGRNTKDYRKHDFVKGVLQLRQAFHNAIWFGHIAWQDYDMFHSADTVNARQMSISKALSAGPVYLSDRPESMVRELIMPLCYQDGLLLQALAPAVPLPDSIFIDPVHEAKAYRTIAPISGGAAAIGIFNLTSDRQPVEAAVKAEDYAYAAAMLQPDDTPWAAPEEGLLAYVWDTQEAMPLAAVDSLLLQLPDFDARLVLLIPIQSGWSVVGRADKYLAPDAVEVLEVKESEIKVRMKEKGPLTIWCKSGEPVADIVAFRSIGGQLWVADLPVEEQQIELTIRRAGGS